MQRVLLALSFGEAPISGWSAASQHVLASHLKTQRKAAESVSPDYLVERLREVIDGRRGGGSCGAASALRR